MFGNVSDPIEPVGKGTTEELESTGTDNEPLVEMGPDGAELETAGGVYETQGGETVTADVEFKVSVTVINAELVEGEVPTADVELP